MKSMLFGTSYFSVFSVFLELKKFSTSKEYTELFGFILNKQAFEC